MKFLAAGQSAKGELKKQNEDAWRIYQDQPMVKRAGRGLLYAVADGVGGTGAGRYASWLVVDTLAFYFSNPAERFDPADALKQIVTRCGDNLRRLAQTDAAYTMAGSTLAMIGILPDGKRAYTFSIGDSPIYVMRGASC